MEDDINGAGSLAQLLLDEFAHRWRETAWPLWANAA